MPSSNDTLHEQSPGSNTYLSGSFDSLDTCIPKVLSAFHCLEVQRDLYREALDTQTKVLRNFHRDMYPETEVPDFIYIKNDDEIYTLCEQLFKEIVWCYARLPTRYPLTGPRKFMKIGQLDVHEIVIKLNRWGFKIPKFVL